MIEETSKTESRAPVAGMIPATNGGVHVGDGARLLAACAPHFAANDEAGLCRVLAADWPRGRLTALLTEEHPDTAKTAAISLGLVGHFDDTPALAAALHHANYFVVMMAERALWTIWLRSTSPACCGLLRDAIFGIQQLDFAAADDLLDQILLADDTFAEACNQRAIMYYLMGKYESSIMACHRTLALNPHHFGAAAGLGHNYFALAQYEAAAAAFKRSLRIHPRMEGVRQAIRRTREASEPDRERESWCQVAPSILSQRRERHMRTSE